ncbi:lytic transglycosylase domain-containing protein [Ramlibacter sp. G-1-2-2]|uniref:Lytic transglycosylase domain-containing protein n=1 Tax=Ramlibacter agri TaxID=2728837 RepID=A0A848H5X7_9BURK|nr:hypothetical protein [Ramlibacter agri]NML44919.1 lytic transglycosylase domain-containing protein [Ramlibacter agri]
MKERKQVTRAHLLALAGLLGAGLTGSMGVTPTTSDTLAQREHAGLAAPVRTQTAQAAVAAITAVAQQAAPAPVVVAQAAAQSFDPFRQLRTRLRWLPVKLGDDMLKTPDAQSRILLAQSAARHADLADVGLSYKDVYGIINAETSWIPRLGSSKDGTPNLGIAQFEPATARAVGLTNPADPVQAVHAAAMHMREAAIWSAHRISGLKLSATERARKLREGVSIYYNLSSKGRSIWNGRNTAKLPFETRRHIANARDGAEEAAELEQQLTELKARMKGSGTITAAR